MVESILAILTPLLSIIVLIMKESLSEDGKAKRIKYEESKALVEGDSVKLSARLSHLFDELQR